MKITYKFGWRYKWYDFCYLVRRKVWSFRKKLSPKLCRVSYHIDYADFENYRDNICLEKFFSQREDIIFFLNSVHSAETDIRVLLERQNKGLSSDELELLVEKRYLEFQEIITHITDYNDLNVQRWEYSW